MGNFVPHAQHHHRVLRNLETWTAQALTSFDQYSMPFVPLRLADVLFKVYTSRRGLRYHAATMVLRPAEAAGPGFGDLQNIRPSANLWRNQKSIYVGSNSAAVSLPSRYSCCHSTCLQSPGMNTDSTVHRTGFSSGDVWSV